MLVGVRCSLRVVCCLLLVFEVRCLICFVYGTLFDVCCLWYVVSGLLCVACCSYYGMC